LARTLTSARTSGAAPEGGYGVGADLKEKAYTTAMEMTHFARKLMD
jgi:hypothetical protein